MLIDAGFRCRTCRSDSGVSTKLTGHFIADNYAVGAPSMGINLTTGRRGASQLLWLSRGSRNLVEFADPYHD